MWPPPAVAMISAEDIVREVDEVPRLLSARADMGVSPESTAHVAQGMARSLEGRIATLRSVSPAAGLQLITAIRNSSFADESKNQLQVAVDGRLTSASFAVSHGPSVSALQPQRLTTPYRYLTQSDWDVIRNDTSTHTDRVQTMIHRCQGVGIASLHEQTVKALINLLVCEIYEAKSTYPNPDDILDMVKGFKRMYKLRTRPVPFARFTDYPASPFDLPKSVFDHAYPVKDDPPIGMTIPMWESTFDLIILRTSSKKLTSNPRQVQQPNAMEPTTAVMGMLADVVRALQGNQPAGNMLQGFRMTQQPTRGVSADALSDTPGASSGSAGANAQGQVLALDNQHSPSAAGLRLQLTQRAIAEDSAQPNVSPARALQFAPPLRGRAEAAEATAPTLQPDVKSSQPLDDAHDGGLGEIEDELEPKADRISSGTYEDAAFNALMKRAETRTSKKRPAAACAVSKRPAAACAGSLLKRPAAAGPKTSSKAEAHFGMPYRNFTSNAYHGARIAAKKRGLSDVKVAKLAQKAYADATAAWNAKA